MYTFHILSLLCALALLVRAAPLPKTGPVMENPDFITALRDSTTLVNKILRDIPAVHASCVNSETLTLNPSAGQNLQYMMTALGIPSAPTLMAISADFTIEMSLNRMSEGLQLYQDLLSTVRNRVSTPEKLDDLLADIRDLLSQVLQMRELAQLEAGAQYGGSGLAAQLAGEYEVKVATHLALTQLQSFSQDMFRSLRNISRAKLVARN